jgi:HD superfamily phosphodiesterase
MNDIKWSKTEKIVAKRAFEAAYQKECAAILSKLKRMIAVAADPKDLWRIDDYLKKQLKRIEEKYDYRYSVLILLFALLLKEGWLNKADFQGLQEDKIEKIKYLATMHLRREH